MSTNFCKSIRAATCSNGRRGPDNTKAHKSRYSPWDAVFLCAQLEFCRYGWNRVGGLMPCRLLGPVREPARFHSPASRRV